MSDRTANPTTNRSLADADFDRIDHALGRPLSPTLPTGRNHFATDDTDLGAALVASGYWTDLGEGPGLHVYSVNDAGRAALKTHLVEIDDPHRGFFVSYMHHGLDREDFVAAKSAGGAKWAVSQALVEAGAMRAEEFFRSVRVQVAAPRRAVPVGRKAPGDGFWPMETPRKPFETISVRAADGKIYAGLTDTPDRGIIEPITNAEAGPVIGEMTGWAYDEGPQP